MIPILITGLLEKTEYNLNVLRCVAMYFFSVFTEVYNTYSHFYDNFVR